jgi:hypothetical protein
MADVEVTHEDDHTPHVNATINSAPTTGRHGCRFDGYIRKWDRDSINIASFMSMVDVKV